MRVQEPVRVAILILTSIGLVFGNGCRSGMNRTESAWKRPNLPGLAFWKKEDDSVPKPPAAHFDPTPAKGETEMAAKSGSTKNNAADLKNSIDKLAKTDTDVLGKPKAKPFDKATEQLDDSIASSASSARPLRTPYQVSTESADKNSGSSLGQTTASAVQAPAGLANKAGQEDFKIPTQIKSAAVKGLASAAQTSEQARDQFNADMQNLTSKAKSNLSLAGTTPGNNAAVLSAAQNKFADVAAQTSNSVATVEKKLSEEQRRLEAEVAKAKQEIADLKKQLTSNHQMLAPIAAAKSGTQPIGPLGTKSSGTTSQDFQPAMATKSDQAFASLAKFENKIADAPSRVGFTPLRPNSSTVSTASSPASSPVTPQYPSTSHGAFSTKGADIQRVALQSPNDSHGSSTDAHEELGSATADVEIPESVLRGTGSFSPGTVNRLRGN